MGWYAAKDGTMKYAATIDEVPAGMTKEQYQGQKMNQQYGVGTANIQKAMGITTGTGGVVSDGNTTGADNIKKALSGGTADSNANSSSNQQPYDWKNSQEYKDLTGQIQSGKEQITQYKSDAEKQQQQTQDAYNAARDAKIAAVRAAINASKSKFNDVVSNAPQEYQAQRNDQAAQTDLNELKLRRSLGNMGYTPNEDISVIQEGNANNALHDRLNQLNIAEKKTIQDAQSSIAQLEAQGATEEASTVYDYATKSLDSINNMKNQLQANLQSMNANYNNDLKGLLDYATGRQDKADEATRLNEQLGLQKRQVGAEISGTDPLTGLRTATQSNADRTFNAGQNELAGKNYYGNDTLQKKTVDSNIGAQNIQNKLGEQSLEKGKIEIGDLPRRLDQQYSLGEKQLIGQDIANQMNQLKFNNMPQEIKDALELSKQQLKKGELDNAYQTIVNSNADEKLKADIDNIYANINQSNAEASASLTNAATNSAEFNAKKAAGLYDPETYQLDKSIKRDQLEAKQLNDITNRLDSLYVTKVFDPVQKGEVPKVVGDPSTIRSAVLALKLPDNQTDYLLSRYGLPTN